MSDTPETLNIHAIGTRNNYSNMEKVKKALMAFGAAGMVASSAAQASDTPDKGLRSMFTHNQPAHSGVAFLWDRSTNATQATASAEKTFAVSAERGNAGVVLQRTAANVKEADIHIRDNNGTLVRPDTVRASNLAQEDEVKLRKPDPEVDVKLAKLAEVKPRKVADRGMEY